MPMRPSLVDSCYCSHLTVGPTSVQVKDYPGLLRVISWVLNGKCVWNAVPIAPHDAFCVASE
jgi:hypothetical protein